MSMSTAGPHYQPIWASGTQNKPVYRCLMQRDGNLVIYNAAGTPLWDSHTSGHLGATAIVQDDGNFVIYAADGRTPIRWTGTAAGQAQPGNIFREMQPHM
ncbi:MAG: hypothetical protein E6J34_08450 [Chloroflexi bacterium]|nr:MAG: hypothetical protein E6J34_08450 [Chloroflexota bacterium]